jgi:outer membrane protein assembly factor BamB
MRSRQLRLVLLFVVTVIIVSCLGGPTRDLLITTSNDMLEKRSLQQPRPLWQIPLGPALIENMELIGPDRLLVGLRKDFPKLPNLDYLVVDANSGIVIWRYDRKNDKGMYEPLIVFADIIVFRVERDKRVSLLAIDAESGKHLWTSNIEEANTKYMPILATALILVVNRQDDRVNLKALNLADGSVVWERTISCMSSAHLPMPIIEQEDIYIFYSGIERFSASDNRIIFVRKNLLLDENDPQPVIEGGHLWVIHSGKEMSALKTSTGSTLWTKTLPSRVKYTNIYPYGDRVYLRGVTEKGNHLLYALRSDNGDVIWYHVGREPNISNLLESDGFTYFGTPTSLVALNSNTGNTVFSEKVTTTGRTFPVHIRFIQDKIIYIGELVVAAYDAKNGKLRYKHGITPVSPECHLNGLDAATENLKQELNMAFNEPTGTDELTKAAMAEMAYYQNLSKTYTAQARTAEYRGDYLKRDLYALRANNAEQIADWKNTAILIYAIVDIGLIWRRALEATAIKTAIERQELFRKSILKAYSQAETQEHVYRPNYEWVSAEDNFIMVSVIHLPTGKRRDTYMSPMYMSYGLWNLIDFKKGVVYHHGIGMNSSLYEMSEARRMYPYNSARTINTFLIAAPVEIPR